MKPSISLLLFGLILEILYLAQPLSSLPLLEESKKCFSHECPYGTVACKRVIKTSDDGKLLITTIACLNDKDSILQEFRSDEKNPYGSHTQFESSSFTGTYTYRSGNLDDNNGIKINNVVNNNVGGLEDLS